MNGVLCILSFMLYFLYSVNGDEVLGCGGFIKSHVPIDFSKIEVKLVTKQGIVKDKTTAAPNNGYYFVPLYDKGELLLELSPPPGWSFEPKQVAVTVDGVSDLCSKGQDINFIFKGFGITGQVESLNSEDGGPEGVTVQLTSKEEARLTTTDQDGHFFFTPVFPGTYTVSIATFRWKVLKKSVEIQVVERNAELPKNSLIIQGYDVKGYVKSDGEPVKGVTVILFAKGENKNVLVEGCKKDPIKAQFKSKVLCHVTSNEVGEFEFGTVSSGNYYIIPYYQGQNIYFQPEQIDFTIKHNSLQLDKSFEIVGFNIPGKVLRSKNVPVPNAKIFLNGQEIMKTDSSGLYRLEKIRAGTYKLRAEADDLIFEEILVRVNPNLQELPDILPSAFKVCGEVASDHSQIVTFNKVGSTKFIQTETSAREGSFCQYLSPGHYEVRVLVSNEDEQKGLQFFPIVQEIEVTSNKILNIMFSQLKTTISGKVQCNRPKDCEYLTVLLKTANEKEVTLKVKDGSYSIDDMYPGTYDVILLPNKFCWKTNKHTVSVNSANIEVPPFVQRGYTVSFISSHDTQVVFKAPGQTVVTKFDVPKGRSSYCLEKPGEYLFTLQGCHSYNPKAIVYNTDAEINEVLLTTQKHTLVFSIQADSDFGNLQVSVKIGTDKVERTLQYKDGRYELDVMLEPGENAVIIPQSETIFFNPPILSVEGREDCENIGVKFVATRGRLFKGRVVPALAGVTITVESTDAETLVVETDSNGIFKFPPLDNNKEYAISATKESYVLSGPDGAGNFLAHKLAEVVVEVLDAADNSSLQGVLLSLSGGESYRRNLQSDENGRVSFHSLSPNVYFLRPMMKEYEFEPDSKIIPVEEGQAVQVKLVGKRVAYSAFGQVVSLNGEPEDNMIVIASGIDNCSHYSEEATCEPTGRFRVRGLQPYCSYRIVVKGNEDDQYTVERTTPEFIEIHSVSNDIKDLKLVVFRPAMHMDVLVKVYAENVDHYKSLKVKLIRESGSPVVVHSTKIDALSLKITKDINPGILLHVPSLPIDNRPYSVQLETNLGQNIRSRSQIHHFNANTSFKYIELEFNVKSSISEQQIKQTSIWSLIFIFTIIFCLYNVELIAGVLRDKFNFNVSAITNLIPIPSVTQKSTNDYYDNAQIDQIVQSINAVKKKPKLKKI